MVVFEYLGATLGVLGSLFVTANKNRKLRFLGFNLWLISNACLITVYLDCKQNALVVMCSLYTITSLIGWWNNRKD